MTKRIISVLIITICLTGFASAGNFVLRSGIGYHTTYITKTPDVPSEVRQLPIGIGGFIGVGGGFGKKGALAAGVEFAPSWSINVSSFDVSNFNYHLRGFFEWKLSKLFSLTAFGGWGGSQLTASMLSDFDNYSFMQTYVVGGRLRVAFVYAEYSAVFDAETQGFLKNEVGVGISFFHNR